MKLRIRQAISGFVLLVVFNWPWMASALDVTEEWYWAVFGRRIGAAGLVAADLTGNGSVEFISSAVEDSSGYWYVVGFDGGDYVQRWTSLPFGSSIGRLVVAQADGDPQLEIIVASEYQVAVFDGSSFEIETGLATPCEYPAGLAVAQVDGDPGFELAVCSEAGTFVYDLETGSQQLALPTRSCQDLAIGETDGTPGLEMVIADGENAGVVVDPVTGVVEWMHPLGFGRSLALGDLDGDTLDEIVAGFAWTVGVQVWHGDSQSFFWGVPVFNLSEVAIADVEGDGPLEVLHGDEQWGDLHVLDGATGGEKWSVENPEHGTGHIAVGDVDGDTVNEIAFGPNSESRLQVVDSASRLIEWRSAIIEGPFYGLAHGDTDGDGEPELVFTADEASGAAGNSVYFIHDAATKQLEYISTDHDLGYGGPFGIAVANLDGDLQAELVLPANSDSDGDLQCRDGLSGDIQWHEQLTEPWPFAAVRVADPDDDGDLEVVSTIGNRYLMVHEASTGVLEWQSFDLGSFFGWNLTLLRVADIDNDGTGEILMAEPGSGRLLAVDPVAATVDLGSATLGVTALDAVDLDDDLVDDIVIGTENGWLRRVDPDTANTTDLAGPFVGEVFGLNVRDVTGDGVLDYVFAADERVHIVDGDSGTVAWVSDRLGYRVGEYDSLVVDDIDGDGVTEIWVNAGRIGHHVYGIRPDGLIFADGFESADTQFWSATVF